MNAIDAVFEFVGGVIRMLVFAFALLLAAPFMLLGWILYRLGWIR